MRPVFELAGLEVDNLLGFMALLGLLRSLDAADSSLHAEAFYDGVPLCAKLRISREASPAEIAAIASAGCSGFAPAYAVPQFADLTFGRDAARRILEATRDDRLAAELRSALFSDAAVRDGDRIDPTPFCAMFGQGHQSFLPRLHNVAAGTVPKKSGGKAVDLNDPSFIERALFAPWTRRDKTESFRWDYEEDRRYALRPVDPSTDGATTEHGANRLAVVGLLSFQSAPVAQRRSGTVQLATRGVSRGRDRRPRITWPIWNTPVSLATIEAMLDDPELAEDEPDFTTIAHNGIVQARRVTRHSVGKFLNFNRAEALA